MSPLVGRFVFLLGVVAAIHLWLLAFIGGTNVVVDNGLWADFVRVAVVASSFGFLAIYLRWFRVGASLLIFSVVMLGGRGGITLTYLTYSLDRHLPLWDAQLAAIDEAFGFSWLAMMTWFDQHQWLSNLGWYCYNSFKVQPFAVPLLLIMVGRIERAQTAVFAGLIGLILTHVIAFYTPAAGAYGHYQVLASQHPNIALASAGISVHELEIVRSGALVQFDAKIPIGMVTFPSLHALKAVVFAWALWSVPYLRWPALALNVGMIIFTPLHGSHFVFDVLVGIALAWLCVVAAAWTMSRVPAAMARIPAMALPTYAAVPWRR